MTQRLDSKIGEQDYNSLLASVEPTAHLSTIEFTPDADFAAGTVLVKTGSSDGYAPISAALTGNDLVVVLADGVAGKGEKVTASVYVAGNFNREKLHAGDSYSLSADDFAFMRQAGLYSENVID